MELVHKTTHIESSGIINSGSFGIDASNPMAYEILSSRIYTRPIEALVREISCNAYDAHVVAGKEDIPFEVHLPNTLAPYFSVKDYGTGLSPEQVGNLFTVYFRSDKTKSNKVIGAYGLGCKTPYAYSDIFEVVVRYHGKRYVYAMSKNETGIPQHNLLGVFDTDEPNGVEVKVPVHSYDFYKFNEAAEVALRYFPVKPNISGNSHFVFKKFSPNSFNGEKWNIDFAGYGKTITVVQGHVGYTFDPKVVLDQVPSTYSFMVQYALHTTLFFDIGEFDTAVSREEVQYTERTKKAVFNKLIEAYQELAEQMKTELVAIATSSKTAWQKVASIRKVASKISSYGGARQFLNMFLDDPIISPFIGDFSFNLGDSPVRLYTYKRGRSGKFRPVLVQTAKPSLIPNENTIIYVVDEKKKARERILIDINNRHVASDTDVFAIHHKDPIDLGHGKLSFDQRRDINEVMDTLGQPDVVYVSSLPVPPSNSKTNSYGLRAYTFGEINFRAYGQSVSWKEIKGEDLEDILEDDKLYIMVENRIHFVNKNGERFATSGSDADWIKNFIYHSISLINTYSGKTYTVEDLIVVPTSCKRLINKTEWIHVFDKLAECVEPARVDDLNNRAWSVVNDKYRFKDNGLIAEPLFSILGDRLTAESPFLNMVSTLRMLKKANSSINPEKFWVLRCVGGIQHPKEDLEKIESYSTIIDDTYSEYPMLKYFSFYGTIQRNSDTFADLIDYVNLIDHRSI